MNAIANSLVTGIVSFIATNIDDIAVLMLFFAQAKYSTKHIAIGQYLGFTILILACIPGYLGGVVIPKPLIGLLGFLPIAIGIIHLRHSEPEAEDEIQAVSQPTWLAKFPRWLSPEISQIALVTLANGGDNIGIYVPLFASSSLLQLGVILITFFLLIGVWCYVAYQLTLHPLIAKILSQYGKAIVPFILIGLGIYILIENKSYLLAIPSA